MQAFILHRRAYRETSALIDFFTIENGLIRAVLRSARAKNGSLAQPFCLLDIELSGKKELKNVRNLAIIQNFFLSGKPLFCGIYLNELLLRLLPPYENNLVIFKAYLQTLQNLQNHTNFEPYLREFEQILLRELGYELVLDFDVDGMPIEANFYYQFDPIYGFKLAENEHKNMILGANLLAIKQSNWHLPEVLNNAKSIKYYAPSFISSFRF